MELLPGSYKEPCHCIKKQEPYHIILFGMWQIALQLVRQGASDEPAPAEVVESNEEKVELLDESSQNSGSEIQSDSELIKVSSQEQKAESKMSGDLLADDSHPNQPVDAKVFMKYSWTLESNRIGVFLSNVATEVMSLLHV